MDLKPCAYCGNNFEIIEAGSGMGFMLQHEGNGDCPMATNDDNGWVYDTREELELILNTRPVEDQLRARVDELEAENDRLETALQRIQSWSKAYPLKVFPEPDFERAHELLKAGGMTLDAIAASNMRHVVEGVGKIASDALKDNDAEGEG